MVLIKVDKYLGRFLKRESQEERNKKAFDFLHSKLPNLKFSIKVKNKTAYFFDLSPSVKSEIFLIREEIIKELRGVLKEAAPNEVSFRKP